MLSYLWLGFQPHQTLWWWCTSVESRCLPIFWHEGAQRDGMNEWMIGLHTQSWDPLHPKHYDAHHRHQQLPINMMVWSELQGQHAWAYCTYSSTRV